jgi:hypothetical protein
VAVLARSSSDLGINPHGCTISFHLVAFEYRDRQAPPDAGRGTTRVFRRQLTEFIKFAFWGLIRLRRLIESQNRPGEIKTANPRCPLTRGLDTNVSTAPATRQVVQCHRELYPAPIVPHLTTSDNLRCGPSIEGKRS